MRRLLAFLFCTAPVLAGLTGCGEDYVENCPVIGRHPSSNMYQLEYKLLIPAKCPIPLASPGTEEKYAAGRIVDLGTRDMKYASVEVVNSDGDRQAYELVIFIGADGASFAEPRAKYKAATGSKTFSDHDFAEFRAQSESGNKLAYGTTKLSYQQTTLATKLTGENIPQPYTTHTWNAPVSGGYPGFSYQWYQDGNPVGNGSSYTGTVGASKMDLRVEVTDQTWSKVAAVLAVDVGGIEASISGPGLAYSSQGGDTWTASARGGTGTYSFDWYLDGTFAGSGQTWSGYPGENGHRLDVHIHDSAGASDTHSFFVRGIGSGDGTCEPVPPALTC
jgi:hypothetical protein